MTKYRVNKHANILHNGVVKSEGSIIDDLTKEQAEKLADFLDIVEDPVSKQTTNKTSTKNSKEKNETKTNNKNSTPDTITKDGGKDNGGNADGK